MSFKICCMAGSIRIPYYEFTKGTNDWAKENKNENGKKWDCVSILEFQDLATLSRGVPFHLLFDVVR
jgi:hypothetical protein